MGQERHPLRYIAKSKFVRSLFLRVLSIFLVVGIAVIATVFVSFSSEINKNILSDRQKQLSALENTVSQRIGEITSIAYHIGQDEVFTLEPMTGARYSGQEMSNTLGRYLIGHNFIEYLAYYRLSEPEKIYVSTGELQFMDFWRTYLGLSETAGRALIGQIQQIKVTAVTTLQFGDKGFFACTFPLPQFSSQPQAFVLAMVPASSVDPLLASLLGTSRGTVAVFDADGGVLYQSSTLDQRVPVEGLAAGASRQAEYIRIDGEQYVVQREISPSNSWTYLCVTRLSDIVSGLAGKQLGFILTMLAVMFVAILGMLTCIIVQYQPISKLAVSVQGQSSEDGRTDVIDESALLSDTLATLQDDSKQKQRFETAYHEAEAANKAKSAFLSSMSHDIRTPMNAIIGMTAIAARHADDPEYVRESLQKVQVASQYLLDIINNVLDMSRIESGRFELAEELVELPRLVYGLVTILHPSVEGKRQRLVVVAEDIRDERLLSDNVRLMQVFMNILSNAVKFTPEGGEIRLHLRQTAPAPEGYGRYVFTFTDTGIGMPPEFVSKVFDTFSRASDSARVEGTGLGMAIARNLVQLMGGTIRCESEQGRGTTFIVELPLKLAPGETGPATRPQSAGPVLIVCADEGERARQRAAFSRCGVCAAGAAQVADAEAELAYAAQQAAPYRLIVLSPTADDPNGCEAAKRLKAAAGQTKPALALAALDLTDLRQADARAAGVDGFAQTPIFHSTALRLLDRAFGPQAAPDVDEADLTGLRVLVVEDNAMNRIVARKILSETKADMTEAANGREAVELFRSHPAGYFDVILMDLQMPVMNGYEATAAIRALPRPDAQTIPIFAMTASTFREDVQQVEAAGMNGHIAKPYTPETLYKVLSGIVRQP